MDSKNVSCFKQPSNENSKLCKNKTKNDDAKRKREKMIGIVILCVTVVLLFLSVIIPIHKSRLSKNEYVLAVKELQAGDTYTFGRYEQDNDKTNGEEEIEWIVLEKQEGKMLLLSKYAIECKAYDVLNFSLWEFCEIRKWLNNDFFNAAFTEMEKRVIPETEVDSTGYRLGDGDIVVNTLDKVFLLSNDEAEQYDCISKCKFTDYVSANPPDWTNDSFDCKWWLRTTLGNTNAGCAYGEGTKLKVLYYPVDWSAGGVRPALWIDVN